MSMHHWGFALVSLVLGPWSNWPARAYLRSGYQLRLGAVQSHLTDCLDDAAPGPLRLVSICAGDGRDVIGVLESHPRRADVEAWLVELDRKSVESGRKSAEAKGLTDRVTFINGDATDYATYSNILPCDIVMMCGVLGHVRPSERAEMVKKAARFCKPGGAIVWTRGVKQGRSRLAEVERLFDHAICEKVRTSVTPDEKWGVVTHRYVGQPHMSPSGGRIFTFDRIAGR